MRKLQRAGYQVIPVNPRETTVHGEPSIHTLLPDIPRRVDIVDVFHRSGGHATDRGRRRQIQRERHLASGGNRQRRSRGHGRRRPGLTVVMNASAPPTRCFAFRRNRWPAERVGLTRARVSVNCSVWWPVRQAGRRLPETVSGRSRSTPAFLCPGHQTSLPPDFSSVRAVDRSPAPIRRAAADVSTVTRLGARRKTGAYSIDVVRRAVRSAGCAPT